VTCYSPLKGWRGATGEFKTSPDNSVGEMSVPCGGCLGCRLARSAEWAHRMVHESHQHEHNCFVTLTYNDESLPYGGTLVKKHFQDFMKRLRRHLEPQKIKYYHCGEYGEQLQRPHYHACFFNLDFGDKETLCETEFGTLYVSPTLLKLWPFGHSTVSDFTWNTAAYCSRYVMKKITGKAAEEHYLRVVPETGELITLQPEYSTSSNGLGKSFFQEFAEDFKAYDQTPVPGKGMYYKIPRYYEKLLETMDPEALAIIKENRADRAQEQKKQYTPEALQAKYQVKLDALDLKNMRLRNLNGLAN